MIEGKKCSNVVLKTRKIGKWVDVNTEDIFKVKKIIFVMSLYFLMLSINFVY